MKQLRYILLTGVVLLLIAGATMLLKGQSTPPPPPVKVIPVTKIKLQQSAGPIRGIPVLAAEKAGIFKKHHLEVDAKQFVKGVDVALLSGQFDASNDGIAPFLAAAIKGGEVKLVGTTIQVDPYYIISKTKKENIKKVAINRLGGDDYYQTVNTFRTMGVDIKKVTFAPAGSYDAKYPFLLKGLADTTGFPPVAAFESNKGLFAKDGFAIIFNRTDDPNAYYPTGINVRTDFLTKHRDAVKDLVIALNEGVVYARNHRDESIALIMEDYKLTQADAKVQYDLFLDGTKVVDMKPKMSFLTDLLQDMSVENKDAKNYDITNYVDLSLTE